MFNNEQPNVHFIRYATATPYKIQLNTVLRTLDPIQYPSTNVQQRPTYSAFRESAGTSRDNSVLSAWVPEPLNPP